MGGAGNELTPGGRWVARASVYFCTFVLQDALLATLLRSQRGLERVIVINNVSSRIFLFLTIASGGLAIWPIVADPYDVFDPAPGVAALLFLGIMLSVTTALAAGQGERRRRRSPVPSAD